MERKRKSQKAKEEHTDMVKSVRCLVRAKKKICHTLTTSFPLLSTILYYKYLQFGEFSSFKSNCNRSSICIHRSCLPRLFTQTRNCVCVCLLKVRIMLRELVSAIVLRFVLQRKQDIYFIILYAMRRNQMPSHSLVFPDFGKINSLAKGMSEAMNQSKQK